MKITYPAVVQKITSQKYYAFCPDLLSCEAYGDDMIDVLEQLNEAARMWIEAELQEEDPTLPPVTDEDDIVLDKDSVIRHICVTVRFLDGYDE